MSEKREPQLGCTAVVMRCDLCKWWRRNGTQEEEYEAGHDDAEGQCHRYPPAMNMAAILLEAQGGDASAIAESSQMWNWSFPATVGNMFCGEFVSA